MRYFRKTPRRWEDVRFLVETRDGIPHDATVAWRRGRFFRTASSNSFTKTGISRYPWTRFHRDSAYSRPLPTHRRYWSPPCHRFTFLQTVSTIENADSIRFVLAKLVLSIGGTRKR